MKAVPLIAAVALAAMKRSEIEAHAQAEDASAWEMSEYFEIF